MRGSKLYDPGIVLDGLLEVAAVPPGQGEVVSDVHQGSLIGALLNQVSEELLGIGVPFFGHVEVGEEDGCLLVVRSQLQALFEIQSGLVFLLGGE